MISTLVVHAPAGIGGTGSVRACTGMPVVAGVPAAHHPWALGVVTAAGLRDPQPAAQRPGAQPVVDTASVASAFATTNYSTLGIHSPGRPQS
jgi:hypothetical protein